MIWNHWFSHPIIYKNGENYSGIYYSYILIAILLAISFIELRMVRISDNCLLKVHDFFGYPDISNKYMT